MRFSDLLTLPVAALWQQKLRTILTTLGVVFGAFVLAASLSIGEGVQETIDRESRRADVARRVEVFAKWNRAEPGPEASGAKVEGEMAEGRRERIRKALAERSAPAQARTELTRGRLEAIAALPGVERMVPLIYNDGFALLGGKSEGVQVVSARPDDESCRRRVVAGRFFDAPGERAVVVSEFLAYRLGLADDAAIDGLVGKTLRLEFHARKVQPGIVAYLIKPAGTMSREERAALDKVTARLPDSFEAVGLSKDEADVLRAAVREQPDAAESEVFSEEFKVVGVMRGSTQEEQAGPWDPLRADGEVLVPYRTAMDLYFRGPGREEVGANLAVLIADSEAGVEDLVGRVAGLGLEARAAVEFIERERLIYLLIFGGMTCVAGVALLVSAVGIANTMLMSVLERTREIGIMKAVGADDRHLLFVFLAEGALIGLIGAVAGLLLAWGASFPADAWIRSMVLRDIKIDLKESIFVFPPWMAATVLLFTVLVTTIAAFYPARHAARIDPVAALRHE